jgi:protein-S-isoprenylcysteine O-methyltransferase Ste14
MNYMIINLGNWFFRYRNFIFPLFYAALFLPSPAIFSSSQWPFIAGTILISLGIVIRCITIGLVYIVRGGKNRNIFAEKLVTGGIYRICRNPMYLGNIILLLGFALFANSLLFLVFVFPLFCLIYLGIIAAEESYLVGKFTDQYLDYRKSTNALLPSMKNLGTKLSGYRFNLRRVILKEHNSLFLYVSGILLLLICKHFISIGEYMASFIALTFCYTLIKLMKAKKKTADEG